jgi:enamine deaminase RidA (YjgF/YER057c/UK114 family)
MSGAHKSVSPKDWPRPKGYSDAMVAEGRIVTLAGQIGWDPIALELVSDDFVQQTRQALANVLTALEAAGGKAEHLIRLNWYITDRNAYLGNLQDIGKAYRSEMGKHFPAMSIMIVSGLLEPGAKVEIEGTAVIPKKAIIKAKRRAQRRKK